ncbi:MAG: hypothetical protein IIC67_05755, partial [Thaumarchaeota archaeon]|nr:hypothetical protein [Nitrososphaerota archaeon]
MVVTTQYKISGLVIGTDIFQTEVNKSISDNNMSSSFNMTVDNYNGKNSSVFSINDTVEILATTGSIIGSTTLIAQYLCEDNAANTVVLDNIGTHSGVATFNTQNRIGSGKIGSAFSFQSFDEITIADDPDFDTGEMGVACWINITGSTSAFIRKYEIAGNQKSWQLWGDRFGRARFNVSTDGEFETSTVST